MSVEMSKRGIFQTKKRIIIYDYYSSLWFTSHPSSTLVLLDTGTVGTSRGNAARILMERLKLNQSTRFVIAGSSLSRIFKDKTQEEK